MLPSFWLLVGPNLIKDDRDDGRVWLDSATLVSAPRRRWTGTCWRTRAPNRTCARTAPRASSSRPSSRPTSCSTSPSDPVTFQLLSLPSFTEFYWVLPSFNRISPGFTRFYWVLPGLTRFYWVLPSFNRISPGFTRFYWVLPGLTRFY